MPPARLFACKPCAGEAARQPPPRGPDAAAAAAAATEGATIGCKLRVGFSRARPSLSLKLKTGRPQNHRARRLLAARAVARSRPGIDCAHQRQAG